MRTRLALLALLLAAIPAGASAQVLAIDPFGSLNPADGSINVDQSIGQKGIFVTFVPSAGGTFAANPGLALAGASVTVAVNGAALPACSFGVTTPAVGACGFVAADGPFTNGVIESLEIHLGDILPLGANVEIDLAGLVTSQAGDTPISYADWTFTARAVAVPRPPLNLELVLDTSGSMNEAAAPGGSVKRREAMRTGIPALFSLLSQYGQAQDRVGTVYFNTTASAFNPGGADKTVGVLGSTPNAMRDNILATLNASTAGATSIGDGLKKARTAGFDTIVPAPAGPNRVVILMSDGIQNTAPNATVAANVLSVDGSPYPDDIVIHPITAGRITSDGYALQDAIASATGGNTPLHVEDTANSIPEADFQTYFVQTLASELVGDKVELVLDETGTMQGRAEFGFPATSDEVALSVFFSWIPGPNSDGGFRPLLTLIAPDGEEVPIRRFVETGVGQVSAKVPLPALTESGIKRTLGDWRLIVENAAGGSTFEFHAMVLLDNTTLASRFDIGGRDHFIGEPLHIEVELTDAAKPVETASVFARVSRPETGLGNLLSKTPGEVARPTGGEVFNPGHAKLAWLLGQPDFVKELDARRIEEIELLDNGDPANGDAVAGDGIYSAVYPDTFVEGHYAFDVFVKAQNRNDETYLRVQQLTAYVRPAVDPGNSSLDLLDISLLDNGSAVATFGIRLADAFGNLVGPGYQTALTLTPSRGRVTNVTDLLDGSYRATIALPAIPGGNALQGPPVTVDLAVVGRHAFSVDFPKLGDNSLPDPGTGHGGTGDVYEELCRALIAVLRDMTAEEVKRQLDALGIAKDVLRRGEIERIIRDAYTRERAAGGLSREADQRLRRMMEAILNALPPQ